MRPSLNGRTVSVRKALCYAHEKECNPLGRSAHPTPSPALATLEESRAAQGSGLVRLSRLIGSPDSKPHLMLASRTGVDANSCVASCRKFVDACDFHLFAASTHGQFGTARHQLALEYGHKSPCCVGGRPTTSHRSFGSVLSLMRPNSESDKLSCGEG